MESFAHYRTVYRGLYDAVKEAHVASAHEEHGHGLDHDVTVAQLAAYIAPNESAGAKAWCASMMHSLDRFVEEESLVETATRSCAATLEELFSDEEIEEIVQAALRHSELNQNDQSVTQQLLMDADRLANLNAVLPIRAGQFRPSISALELQYLSGSENPASTYSQPKSVLDDLRSNMREYLPQLRLPKAKELGAEYADRLSRTIANIETEYAFLGLVGIEL